MRLHANIITSSTWSTHITINTLIIWSLQSLVFVIPIHCIKFIMRTMTFVIMRNFQTLFTSRFNVERSKLSNGSFSHMDVMLWWCPTTSLLEYFSNTLENVVFTTHLRWCFTLNSNPKHWMWLTLHSPINVGYDNILECMLILTMSINVGHINFQATLNL